MMCFVKWHHEVILDQGPMLQTYRRKASKSKCSPSHRFFLLNAAHCTHICPCSFSTPLNSYKCQLGGSHSSVPAKLSKSRVSIKRAVAGTACRIFKFVSPSKFDVSINDMEFGSLDDNNIISAGTDKLFGILTMSPTTKCCHLMASHCPFRIVSTSRWLMTSSARWRFWIVMKMCNHKKKKKTLGAYSAFYNWWILTKSSTISLIALTANININGTNVVYRPVGETSGICWSRAMNRKKQFE